jgi:hypothetical protein
MQAMLRPVVVAGQRAPALRLEDPRVLALFSVLTLFRLLPTGFSNAEVRTHVAPLLGLRPEAWPRGRVTYDLRRLRLRGLIERVPHSHRYRVTDTGFRTGVFCLKIYERLLRPGLAALAPQAPATNASLQAAFAKLDAVIDRLCTDAQVAA